MRLAIKCKQAQCGRMALYRYTLPGHAESHLCEQCYPKAEKKAEKLGLPLRATPLTAQDHMDHANGKR